MTAESPGFAEQGSTYGAVVLRRAFGTLLQRGSSIASIVGGLVGSGDMLVTAGSGMHVEVAPGEAWVPGTSSATQSGYYCRVESSTTLAIAASSETNPRIDTVIAKVIDKAYAGTEETFSVAVVTGTAEAGATLANKKGAGAVPASSLVLAYVLVPAKAVSISGGNVENVAPLAAVGLPPWRSVEHATSYTAALGEMGVCTASVTVTLPAPTFGAFVAVNSGNGNTITVNAAGGVKIYGDFTAAAATVTLLSDQHLWLFGGGSYWFIIAGEPKREANYVAQAKKATGTGVTPSASRPALVTTWVTAGTLGEISVEGQKLAPLSVPANTPVTFLVGAGMTGTIGTSGGEYTYTWVLL